MRKAKLVLALVCSLSVFGCAALPSVIAVVASVVSTAGTVLDSIEAFADTYFAAKPDAGFQQSIATALTRCRVALVAVQQASRGAEDLNDRDYHAALSAFLEAYQSLLDVVAPIGVRVTADGRMSASPGTLSVPSGADLVAMGPR